MLKLMAELTVGVLSFVAVRKQCDKLVTPITDGMTAKQVFIAGNVDGFCKTALVMGSALAWPVTAPIGLYKVGKYTVQHRAELIANAKALPGTVARSTKQIANRAKSVFTKGKTEDDISPWFLPE